MKSLKKLKKFAVKKAHTIKGGTELNPPRAPRYTGSNR